MNKKSIIIIVLFFAGILVVFGQSGINKIFNIGKSTENISTKLYQTGGKVIENENGVVKFSFSYLGKERTVELIIASSTIIKNPQVSFTKEQLQSGKTFKPGVTVRLGKISDLVPGTSISLIKSKQDLLMNNKVEVAEINYLTYEYPKTR